MKKLRAGKEATGNFSSEPICTFMNWRLFLANFSVVFWKKTFLTLSRESGIFGPDKRRRFHWLSEGEHSMELHCKDKGFAEKSR